MERGVVFSVHDQLFALPLEVVARVVRAVHITELQQGPRAICGVIDVRGEMLPVLDMRARLGMPRRALALADQFIIARTPSRALALWVDRVQGVAEWGAAGFVPSADMDRGATGVKGVARGAEGLLLVHDLDALCAEPGALTDA